MKTTIKKKLVWSSIWLFVFWFMKGALNEFLYMETAENSVHQFDGSTFDQALSVKLANGFYDNVFYASFALLIFIIWVGPVLKLIFNKQEKK